MNPRANRRVFLPGLLVAILVASGLPAQAGLAAHPWDTACGMDGADEACSEIEGAYSEASEQFCDLHTPVHCDDGGGAHDPVSGNRIQFLDALWLAEGEDLTQSVRLSIPYDVLIGVPSSPSALGYETLTLSVAQMVAVKPPEGWQALVEEVFFCDLILMNHPQCLPLSEQACDEVATPFDYCIEVDEENAIIVLRFTREYLNLHLTLLVSRPTDIVTAKIMSKYGSSQWARDSAASIVQLPVVDPTPDLLHVYPKDSEPLANSEPLAVFVPPFNAAVPRVVAALVGEPAQFAAAGYNMSAFHLSGDMKDSRTYVLGDLTATHIRDFSAEWTVSPEAKATVVTDSETRTVNVTFAEPGTYTLTAIVDDVTDSVLIVVGANPDDLAYILLVDEDGDPLVAHAMTTDDTITVYAQGYDHKTEPVEGFQNVMWQVVSDPNAEPEGPTTSYDYVPKQAGVATLMAFATRADGLTVAATVIFSVSPGATDVAYILILDASDEEGNMFVARDVTIADVVVLHAAAFNHEGAYLGTQEVDWHVASPSGLETNDGPASSFDYEPKEVGLAAVLATLVGSNGVILAAQASFIVRPGSAELDILTPNAPEGRPIVIAAPGFSEPRKARALEGSPILP